MTIATIGIDLAKSVFQLHGVNEHGKVVLRRQIHRGQMRGVFVNLPPCVIGMEACASAHYWARTLEGHGHTLRLLAPHFVKPYVKTHKNNATDAKAIREAVSRPHMRFVPIKSAEQQSSLSLHRARQGFVRARTAGLSDPWFVSRVWPGDTSRYRHSRQQTFALAEADMHCAASLRERAPQSQGWGFGQDREGSSEQTAIVRATIRRHHNCSLIAHRQGGRSTLDRCARDDSAAHRLILANCVEKSRYRDRARVRSSDTRPRAKAEGVLQTPPSQDLTRSAYRHIETLRPQNVAQRRPQQSPRIVVWPLSWLHANTHTCRPNSVLFLVHVHHTEIRSTVFRQSGVGDSTRGHLLHIVQRGNQ